MEEIEKSQSDDSTTRRRYLSAIGSLSVASIGFGQVSGAESGHDNFQVPESEIVSREPTDREQRLVYRSSLVREAMRDQPELLSQVELRDGVIFEKADSEERLFFAAAGEVTTDFTDAGAGLYAQIDAGVQFVYVKSDSNTSVAGYSREERGVTAHDVFSLPGFNSFLADTDEICDHFQSDGEEVICGFIIGGTALKAIKNDPTKILQIASATCLAYNQFCDSMETIMENVIGYAPGDVCSNNQVVIHKPKWWMPVPKPIIVPACENNT
ncbi:hypothetical protein [Haloarchaeobius baliensis]|uniref:hypothetical protein n=1 Tax=Haloarchaeobius baliensis TaxID=1670458 RepID=UPI003F88306E